VPQVLLLFRSLKYSAHGIEALGELVEEVEVDVDANRALGERVAALETAAPVLEDDLAAACWRRWSLALVMLEKCEDSTGARPEA
jgi:hypothetical protein